VGESICPRRIETTRNAHRDLSLDPKSVDAGVLTAEQCRSDPG